MWNWPQVSIANTDRCYIDDGYKLFNCEILFDILCLDCVLLGVKVNSSYEGVYLKAESSNKNTEYMPGGYVKPNIITVFDKNVWIGILHRQGK